MGILDVLGSGVAKLGSAVQSAGQGAGAMFQNMGQQFQPPADPRAINPQYGVPEGDVYNQRMESLRRMSALFMAAGQSMSGRDRAMLLAQLGDNDPSKSLYTMAQTRLMNRQVQDAERKRTMQEQALEKLRAGVGLSENFDSRERELFNLYLEAGDLEGALDVVSKVRQQRGQGVLLPDGSQSTLGVLKDNNNDWNKNWQPMIRGAREAFSIADEARAAIKSGVFSGSLGPAKMAATKLMRAAGINVDVSHVKNTEQLRAAVIPEVLRRMSMLGGNDSNEELRTMMASLAGDTLEPETLLSNFDRMERAVLQDAAQAHAQKRMINTNGSAGYGTYQEIDPELDIPKEWKERWERVTGAKQSGGGASASGGGVSGVSDEIPTPQTDEDFANIPVGARFRDPADGKIYIKE